LTPGLNCSKANFTNPKEFTTAGKPKSLGCGLTQISARKVSFSSPET